VSDPDTVTVEQMRAAYDALGLDPQRFKSTRSVHIQPGDVEVVRYHQVDGGSHLVEGSDAICMELLTLRLVSESGTAEHEPV
jgi:hypothetical protein